MHSTTRSPLSFPLLLSLLCLALSALVPPADASTADRSSRIAEPVAVFGLTDGQPLTPREGVHAIPYASEEYWIDTSPELLAANPEVIQVRLPGGLEVEAVRNRFTDYGPEWKSWSGTLRSPGSLGRGSGYAYFGYHGKRITAVIKHAGERYRITGLDREQRLVKLDLSDVTDHNCGLNPAKGAEPIDPKGTSIHDRQSGPELSSETTTLDLMVLYPTAYFSSPTTQIYLFDYIEDTVGQANDIFDNSGVNAEYNVVHIGPIIGTQPSLQGPQGGLDLLNDENTEITTLRSAYGADFINVFVPYYWDDYVGGAPPCGVANMSVYDKIDEEEDTYSGERGFLDGVFNERAFSAQRQSCGFGDFTMAHEMGHNWSMWHSTQPHHSLDFELLDAYDDYSLAYYIEDGDVDKNTAMGCLHPSGSGAGVAAVCERIDHFSDDQAQYMSMYDTGDASHDNAKLAKDQLSTYAAFESTQTINEPTASFTVSCNSGTRKCTFDASGTSDNGSIDEYYWHFGDGTSPVTTTSDTIMHTYGGSGTFYWVHLVATDDDDQRDLAINSATF